MNHYGSVPMDLTPPPLSEEERSMLCRLPPGGRVERQKYIPFTFNGIGYLGLEGDTLASALLANHVRLVHWSWMFTGARAGLEDPNPVVQVLQGGLGIARVRMDELALFEGLEAESVDARPHGGEVNPEAPIFSGPISAWRNVRNYFERHRSAPDKRNVPQKAADCGPDAKQLASCDVLVVGGGIAGLSAALAAGSSGARVICADEQTELGGWLLSSAETVDGLSANAWVANARKRLQAMPGVTLLSSTTVLEYHERNRLTLSERRIERLPAGGGRVRECLWEVHAKQVVLATGAQERAMVFPKNGLPGVMPASAVSTYIRRFAVLPGSESVVCTSNDAGYDTALALQAAGAHVKVIDSRALTEGPLTVRAKSLGIAILPGHVLVEAVGVRALRAVKTRRLGADGGSGGPVEKLVCDLLAVSAGFSPVLRLHCQSGATSKWSDDQGCLVPGSPVQAERSAGSCHGLMGLEVCAQDGHGVGLDAAMAALH